MKFFSLIYLFLFLTTTAFAQENCGNGIDDDGDGFIDCYDSDCMNGPVPSGSFFNTANNGTGGTLAGGTNDLNWQVSIGSFAGPYVPAIIMSSTPGVYYISPWPDCGWISHSNDGTHSADEDFYYKIEFMLPCYTPCGLIGPGSSAFCLNMDFFADNSVDEIYVNGTPQSADITGVPATDPYYNWGFGTAPITTSLCKDWQPGLNVLIVKVSSGPSYEAFLAQNSTSLPPSVIHDATITIPSTTTLCDQDPPITLTAASAGGTWSGSCGACINSTTGVFNPTIAGAGNHTIIYNITTPCPASDTITIQVLPLPNVTITPESPRCENDASFNLTAATSGGIWSGMGITNPSNGTFDPSTAGVGSHIISYSVLTPCQASDTVSLLVTQMATTNAGSPQTICSGSTVILAGSVGGSATSGIWSGGNGTYNPNNITLNAVYLPSAAENAEGTATLSLTSNDPSGPCSVAFSTVIITINPIATINAGPDQKICTGGVVQLAGTVGGSATSGTWTGGSGTFNPNNTIPNAVYTPTVAEETSGMVLLTFTSEDPPGPCNPVSSVFTLSFYPNPAVDFTVDAPKGCPVHCVNFSDLSTVAGGGNITAWAWNFGDSQSAIIKSPSHCFENTGYYDIELTVTTNNGCKATLTIPERIQVYAIPNAEFTPTPNPVSILNSTSTMTNQASNDVVYWNWNFGDGVTLPNNITPSPAHTYSNISETNYLVTLIVQNADGCWDTVAHPIVVGPEFTFFIPNAFTPNGDGTNDDFKGSGIGIKEYDIWIFDRWGIMIFHTDTLTDGWDGKANKGKEIAQQDVYVWKVKLTDVFNKTHHFIGIVTLVK